MTETPKPATPAARRRFLKRAAQAAGGASLMSLLPVPLRSAVWAAGSDAPEKKEVRIGFIPLTDCSSVVMATVMEFDKKYGIKIIPSKEAILGLGTRQAGQRRAGRGACALRTDLRGADGRRRP